MGGENKVMKLDYIDFEKVVFGWQHIARYFELGKHTRIIAESAPDNPKIELHFWVQDASGKMIEKVHGGINRLDCERFFAYSGMKIFDEYEVGKKQRIIVEYDPQGKNAFIEFQEMH